MSNNIASLRLKNYQRERFFFRSIGRDFDGFDLRAYPETSTGWNLDQIGEAIKITRKINKNGTPESCEKFRKRIILALETPDPEEENKS